MGTTARRRHGLILLGILVLIFFLFFPQATTRAASPPDDVDLGIAPDEQQGGGGLVGVTVRILNGNVVDVREDVRFSSPNTLGLVLQTTFNSRSGTLGALGYGWTHTYEVSLDPSVSIEGQTFLKIVGETGRASYFQEETPGLYRGAFNERSQVRAEGGGYAWYRLDGSRFGFSSSGLLLWLEDERGNRLDLGYDTETRPLTVTDLASGRSLTFQYNAEGRLTSVSGPVTVAVPTGTWVSYGYDGNQNLISVTYADGSGLTYAYTDPGDPHNLTEKRDTLGHLLATWSYETSDRAVGAFSPDGKGATIAYVSATQVNVTDAYGTLRSYTLGLAGGRTRVTAVSGAAGAPYSEGNAVKWVYDAAMRLTEVDYAGGTINRYQGYDDQGNPATVILASGASEQRTITYTYHPEMNTPLTRTETSVLRSGNKVTIWDYDSGSDGTPNESPTRLVSRLIERGFTKNQSGAVIPYEYVTTSTYNARGQALTIDGPLPGTGDTVAFTYDASTGDLLTVSKPLVGSTVFSDYDGAGRPGRVTDANNQARTFTYDGGQRVLSVTAQAAGGVTIYTYTGAGKLESVTDPDGAARTFTYSADYGRLVRITDSLGNSIASGYDTQGNRIETGNYSPLGTRTFWKRYSYQHPTIPGKLYREVNADDTYTEYGYDSALNLSSVKDPKGNTTTYGYDRLSRLTTVTRPGSVTTRYAYNRHDDLTSVTDAESHVTSYAYDDMGRLVSTTSPDTGTTSYAYDEAGSLLAKTDAKGITTTYAYDALGRITAIHFPDSSQDITYGYDLAANGKGKLTQMTDPSGSAFYGYNPLGNLASETRTIDGRAFTVGYSYTSSARLDEMTYPSGRRVTYDRDLSGRVSAVASTYNGATTILGSNISHCPFGSASGMQAGYGGTVNNVCSDSTRTTVANPGAPKERVLARDANGNLTSIQGTTTPWYNQSFTYDALNRLTGGTGWYGTIGYTYDRVGNRLTQKVNGQQETYTYVSGTNRLQQVSGPSPLSFTYDANGNTTSIAEKTFTYNQNNRLVKVEANGATLGEYAYNGRGERVRKTAGGQTTLFIYDKDGNLVTEADEQGRPLREYVYLGRMRLAMFDYGVPSELQVTVSTSKGRLLEGVPVYAFTESGSYTGVSASTEANGVASFQTAGLPDGTYKFRADYLSYQFWSPVITVPGTSSTQVVIQEGTAQVTVNVSGGLQAGVPVYVFNESGSYLGIYGTTDSEGKVAFNLPAGLRFRFRADYLGSQYWSDTTVIGSGGGTAVPVEEGGGILTVWVEKDPSHPLSGINAYIFAAAGSYLGLSQVTDADGRGSYQISSGTYRVRADYLGYQFWSEEVTVTGNAAVTLTIPHQDVTVTTTGAYGGNVEPRSGLNVYLFTPSGYYLGQSQVTDPQGRATFNLPGQPYKVRADYLSQQYWSSVFTWMNSSIVIEEGVAEVSVTAMGAPVQGVKVYAFDSSGSYLGISGLTNADGKVWFRLPGGDYNFRADHLGSQYWSGVFTIIADLVSPVPVSAGGGSFTLTVLKGDNVPLPEVNCYVFNDSGSYLGLSGLTSSEGQVGFDLPDGAYKIRVDHLGYQFWTEIFSVPATLSLTHTIPHQNVTVTVEGDYSEDIQPFASLNVYLFTPSGFYLGLHQVTDSQGRATFNLPAQAYKVRADYLSGQYWSEVFTWEDTVVTIPEGVAQVAVRVGNQPVTGAPVYAFSSGGSYLGLSANTNASGMVEFRLPVGSYRFRADYQGNQYRASAGIVSDTVNYVEVSAGGGEFRLSVDTGSGPLAGVKVYVFSAGGSYLGISGTTDANGQVSFALSQGSYKFRVDYLGYQFWSLAYDVPRTLSDIFTILHDEVAVTVDGFYLTHEPIQGVKFYLFTASGSYLGISGTTDANGQVRFSLPDRQYKVRADYLGGQFWSNTFQSQDTIVTINEGLARVHVHRSGVDQEGLKVYLFSAGGSYLSRSKTTDASGEAEFVLPDRSFKFRVDQGGKQYWSALINIIAWEENPVELDLDQLALIETNNPNPVRFDGVPPVPEREEKRLAGLEALVGIIAQAAVGYTSNPKVYYYLNDHLGTPQLMVDSTGTVVWEARYKPFGEAQVHSSSAVVNNFRFPGQYYDQETGLHYNYHRDYHPGIGRYVEPDPSLSVNIGAHFAFPFAFQPQDPSKLSLFGYVNSNPIDRIDIFGLREAGYGGWEGQFIGGYGRIYVTCCDEQCKLWRHEYRKICAGAGFIAGISGGAAFEGQGTNCSNPPKRLLGAEFGFGLVGPFGIEGGIAFDIDQGGGAPYFGGSAGAGFKATVCFYQLSESKELGNCSR